MLHSSVDFVEEMRAVEVGKEENVGTKEYSGPQSCTHHRGHIDTELFRESG